MKTTTSSILRSVIIAITSLLALAPLSKAQTEKEMLENYVNGIVASVAAGEIVDNSNFEIFSFTGGVLYSKAGYLDVSQPLTPARYAQLMKSPSLFGALFYLHRSCFVGNWQYDIQFSCSGEFVSVVGRDQERCLEIVLCRNHDESQYIIDVDRCKYNGVYLAKIFGYECKENDSGERPVPVSLPQDVILKVKKVLNIE